jgi:hypothetical protein
LLEVIQEIGAAAGVATIVGLPVLSILHFSHARDVKRLHEWSGRAPQRSERPIATIVLVGLLVLGGAAAYGVTRLTRDGGAGTSVKPRVNHHGAAPSTSRRVAVEPRNVTVAVLNGTTVPGLAAALGDQLAAAGFKKGTIDVNSDQQLTASVVQYAPGHQAAAKAVGRALAISGREPVTPESRALAPDATVIVIAGADKAP